MVREGRREKVFLNQPDDVFRFMADKAKRLDREYSWRIDVDVRNQLIGWELISIGTLSASLIHPREIFKGAILSNAAGFFLVHNHPSGDETPSREDREVTRRIGKAGELLGIPLLDHVILAKETFYSFRAARSLQ